VAIHETVLKVGTPWPSSARDSVILGMLSGGSRPAADLRGPRRPSAAILTCVDERVVPETIFGCAPGGLYSVRLAGHVVTPEVVSSLEIALGLGCRLVVVLGHTDCSAVRLEREHTGDHFAIVQRIRWATRSLPWRATLEEAIEANVRASVAELRDRLRVRIVGGIYDLTTGEVRSLG